MRRSRDAYIACAKFRTRFSGQYRCNGSPSWSKVTTYFSVYALDSAPKQSNGELSRGVESSTSGEMSAIVLRPIHDSISSVETDRRNDTKPPRSCDAFASL